MSERIRVVGLGGSLAPASKSLAALRIALDAAEAGADVELFDIRALDLPLFRPGMGEAPAAARRWAEAACEASGLLWRSPLYHGTISGSFKNALDWLHILADRDPVVAEQLRALGREVVRAARQLATSGECDYASARV
jgi:FMN reductase